ncbi:monovalent cation:proton antiporter-2 (CPA2) family protein [Pulveribacter sp.]|uniref:monovalent cation:proton antiporter-2 (CPA2) family protein n=1 Tax=Pulveribacter sp. TaxID=2678893 RepID=UPI000ED88689|nr:monovalent cation:proton antiporter-2 (CPA2) family protein [Pulveribacter sp.]HCL86193.1 potassium transporter [Comamonadaceae bacterium]
MSSLALTLLYLLAAVLGVVACRSLRLPPMMGYLAAGILIGPHALALTSNSEGVRHLGEFGVVFLMFTIGLEFNLPKLRAMRRHVFGLGLLQVVVSAAVFTAALLALSRLAGGVWQMGWQSALALGGTLAMSSTAIVVKLLSERGELESEHGRRVLGILLFQDLAVVPLLVLIPALGSSPDQLLLALGLALLKAVLLVGVLLVGGQRVMRWWLTLVARRKSDELFMLNLLLVTLGLAWLTELAGLSLALGAFIAGVLVSETEYRHQVGTDIRPFHDVLLGLFFITVGMMLDWHILIERWALVLALLLVPLLAKTAIIVALARVQGATAGVSLRTALFVGQAGEFGFVLLSLMQTHALVEPALMNPVLAAMVLSMLATPFLVLHSNRIVMKLAASDWMHQSLQVTTIARQAINTSGHVLICGYGRCGQNLARMLEGEGIAYMALDLDPDRVRQAAAAGNSVVYGDATRLQALMAAGLARAAAVVVTYLDTPAALKVLASARTHAPHVPVVVRTQDDTHLDQLQAAGATEVVPEAIEGSLMLASHALALLGVPMRRVLRVVRDQRDARYGLLRGYFHGADDDTVAERDQERLATVTLPAGAAALGQAPQELPLHAIGVRLVSVRSASGHTSAQGGRPLAAGDTLVLSGHPTALALAEQRLLRG